MSKVVNASAHLKIIAVSNIYFVSIIGMESIWG